MNKNLILLFSLAFVAVGCVAPKPITESVILSHTSGVLGIPENNLKISDVRSNPPSTYYNVVTNKGVSYACTMVGGGVMFAGLVNPPTCNKK